MQRGNNGNAPFHRLGDQLKRIRQTAKESLAEASGAVEIDLDVLDRYERGESRPTEDILLLLITHFDLTDEDADTLWHLAGYDKKKGANMDENNLSQQAVTILPMDARIVYTDMINVTANNFGVVMNFLQQGIGQNNQNPVPVARVGMSLDHARSVLEVLRHTIEQTERQLQTRMLPAPQNENPDKKTTN